MKINTAAIFWERRKFNWDRWVSAAIAPHRRKTIYFSLTLSLHSLQIYSPGAHRMSVPLCSEDQYCIEASSAGHAYGSILLGLSYNTKKRSLVVQIKRCANLMAKDNNGFSDPFVKLQVPLDPLIRFYYIRMVPLELFRCFPFQANQTGFAPE